MLKNDDIFFAGSSVTESKPWKTSKRDTLEYWWPPMLLLGGSMSKILRKCKIHKKKLGFSLQHFTHLGNFTSRKFLQSMIMHMVKINCVLEFSSFLTDPRIYTFLSTLTFLLADFSPK